MKVDSKTPHDPWSWGDSRQQVMKVTPDKKLTAKLYLKMVIIVIHKPLFQWSWGGCYINSTIFKSYGRQKVMKVDKKLTARHPKTHGLGMTEDSK